MSFTNEDVTLAVKKGINWLDDNYPNWVQEIDLSTLAMDHCHNCIIGQTLGSYRSLVGFDGQKDGEWAMEHGFCAPTVITLGGIWNRAAADEYYARLEAVWSEEVRKRLS